VKSIWDQIDLRSLGGAGRKQGIGDAVDYGVWGMLLPQFLDYPQKNGDFSA